MTTIYVTDTAELPKRISFDHYPTERNLIKAALDHFVDQPIDSVLDIGAGDGRWGQIAKEKTGAAKIVGVEKRFCPQPDGFTQWDDGQDFLSWPCSNKFDLIVSNPPYYIAEKIIRKAYGLLADSGIMLILLRLSFQASIKRREGLFSKLPMVTVGVLSRRPSFYGRGTNGTDYGIFHWIKGQGTPREWKTILLYYERG